MPWYGYAFLTALGIALVSLLQKRTLQHEHSLEYVTVFSAIKALLFVGVFWNRIDWSVNQAQAWWLVASASIGAFAFFMIVKAMRRMEVSSVTPIIALEPGLVALVAAVTLKEVLSGTQLVGVLLLVLGTYILELQHYPAGWWKTTTGNPFRLLNPFHAIVQERGGWFAVMSLIGFTVSALFARRVLIEVPATTYIAYDTIIVAMIFLIVFSTQRQPLTILRPGQGQMIFAIVIIASIHLTGGALQAVALTMAPVGLVIAAKRTSVLIDIILSGRLFHEHHLAGKLVAALVMLIGTVFLVQL